MPELGNLRFVERQEHRYRHAPILLVLGALGFGLGGLLACAGWGFL